ncbi:hypothetical protein M011DRAFT_104153 [Sporormia fimetaria CBS 119925]|uniref:NADH:ubiquinone oxidoreductase 20.1kD subunit n=1 Tax=Sporormia fimetaria CBS 119925 TaxID=1340428 RepID=A0A6A6VM12_9PLEO|nr:hypothetical protein M011DRAFT_104153 [Sporormia fimetaria CBS 119925]
MLSRRFLAARPLLRTVSPAAAARPRFIMNLPKGPYFPDDEWAKFSELTDLEDPNMNGGYINPPMEKRGNRDPYADWWDKQERRNYGEPVHEDNDILGALALHDYDHFTPGWAATLLGGFVVSVLVLCGAVKLVYPDKISVPREFEGGLEAELGGPRAVRTRAPGDPVEWKH